MRLTGTAMAASAASTSSEAAAEPQTGVVGAKAAIPPRSVSIAVRPGIKAQTLHAAIDQLIGQFGCLACGLNGILDLRIDVVNPEISERFAKDGVLGVNMNVARF